jgi:hypothetical protein
MKVYVKDKVLQDKDSDMQGYAITGIDPLDSNETHYKKIVVYEDKDLAERILRFLQGEDQEEW